MFGRKPTCGYCVHQAVAAQSEAQSGNKAALQDRFVKILQASKQAPPPPAGTQTIVVRNPENGSVTVVETAPPSAQKAE